MLLHVVQQYARDGHKARIEDHVRIVELVDAEYALDRLLALLIQVVVVEVRRDGAGAVDDRLLVVVAVVVVVTLVVAMRRRRVAELIEHDGRGVRVDVGGECGQGDLVLARLAEYVIEVLVVVDLVGVEAMCATATASAANARQLVLFVVCRRRGRTRRMLMLMRGRRRRGRVRRRQ